MIPRVAEKLPKNLLNISASTLPSVARLLTLTSAIWLLHWTLFPNNDLTVFQIVLLSSLNLRSSQYFLLVFLSQGTQIFLSLLNLILDSTDMFFKNWCLNLDLFMIALLSSLVTKLEWLALRYLFFKGAYLSHVSTMVHLKASKSTDVFFSIFLEIMLSNVWLPKPL